MFPLFFIDCPLTLFCLHLRIVIVSIVVTMLSQNRCWQPFVVVVPFFRLFLVSLFPIFLCSCLSSYFWYLLIILVLFLISCATVQLGRNCFLENKQQTGAYNELFNKIKNTNKRTSCNQYIIYYPVYIVHTLRRLYAPRCSHKYSGYVYLYLLSYFEVGSTCDLWFHCATSTTATATHEVLL